MMHSAATTAPRVVLSRAGAAEVTFRVEEEEDGTAVGVAHGYGAEGAAAQNCGEQGVRRLSASVGFSATPDAACHAGVLRPAGGSSPPTTDLNK